MYVRCTLLRSADRRAAAQSQSETPPGHRYSGEFRRAPSNGLRSVKVAHSRSVARRTCGPERQTGRAFMHVLTRCVLCLLLAKSARADDDDRPTLSFSGSWDDSSATSLTKKASSVVAAAAVSKSSNQASSSDSDVSSENAAIQKPIAVSTDPVTKLLGLPSFSALQEQRRKVLKTGAVVVKWRLQYYNMSVYGNVATARFEKGGKLSGRFRGDPASAMSTLDRVPRIKEGDALARVATAMGLSVDNAAGYVIKNVKVERILRYDGAAARLKLCYRVSFVAEWTNGSAAPVAPHGVVDAMTGALISVWDGIHTQSAETNIAGVGGNIGVGGTSQPLKYTDVPATKAANGRCSYDGSVVQVQNMRGSTFGAFSVASFVCSDATNTSYDRANGGYSPLNEVARNAAATVRMYQDYLGTAGPTGTLPVRARVHYGINYENAFYDGQFANFGDGALSLYPPTSLDIVAHELSHGFTQVMSGLEYYGQSGAISESFADMAGVTAVYYDTGKANFAFGSSIAKSGLPLRNMCNPRSDGRSIDNFAQYKSSMDVHYASGLYNKVFCILATQWNIPTAFQLFAYANAFYWGQLTTFATGVCGVMNAAGDMGVSSATVAAAFSAVGLTCPS